MATTLDQQLGIYLQDAHAIELQALEQVKRARFAYAFEHLEIASYELLRRVAAKVGDTETISAADEILVQGRTAAARVHGLFDHALGASLEEAGVKA